MSKPKRVSGLWRNKSGNGYGCKLKEAVTIPAGARLLLFKVREEHKKPNGPDIELCVVIEEDAATERPVFNERRDAPEKHVTPQQSRAAVEMQAPPGWNERLGDEIPF